MSNRSRRCDDGRWPALPCPPAGWPSPKPSVPCPSILDQLEHELERLGLAQERFTVRMTGCPNGCARPYNADVGLVGRSAHIREDGTPGPGKYTIFLGGRTVGDRLNIEYKDYVPYDQVVSELVPVLMRFKNERMPGESFGDYCDRIGVENLATSSRCRGEHGGLDGPLRSPGRARPRPSRECDCLSVARTVPKSREAILGQLRWISPMPIMPSS